MDGDADDVNMMQMLLRHCVCYRSNQHIWFKVNVEWIVPVIWLD